MKKFFALALALVMALSLTTVAWGATPVTTEGELKAALAAGGDIVLGANITIENTTGTSDWAVVGYGKTVTLDLAGYTITRTANDTLGAIRVLGELIVNDSSANKTGGISGGDYAIVVGWKGYEGDGAKLTINGGTFTGGYAITGNGTVPTGNNKTNWGTEITINGGIITGTDVGIYHPQVGTLTINGGTISGATGVEVRGGTLEITGGDISATSNTYSSVANGNGATSTGVAVAVAQHTTKQDINVTISGGELSGVMAFAEENPEANADPAVTIDITGGEFDGDVAVTDDQSTEISGGTFNTDVSEYVADGSSAVLSGGKLVVSVGNTGNTNSYDASDVTIVAKDGSKVTIATDAKVVMTQESKKTVNGKFASVIPAHFTYNGVKYVVCHEMSATHLVTVKGAQYYTCAFNGFVPTVEKDGGALYTAPKKATCGKVGANEDKYVVIDNIYYLVSNLGTRYVLVNDKMVVYSTTTATAEVHVYDAVKSELKYNSDRTVANFKCAVCNNAIPVVAKKPAFATNYTAITLGVEGTYYYVTNTAGISAGSSTPSTDKTVTSAETFDAGIAMYVGMSVMAAAGSAVVIGKKKD